LENPREGTIGGKTGGRDSRAPEKSARNPPKGTIKKTVRKKTGCPLDDQFSGYGGGSRRAPHVINTERKPGAQ